MLTMFTKDNNINNSEIIKQSRRARLREATCQEIKSTAWRQIGEQGAAALSLRAIAQEIGLTAPALYRYYQDRDALVTALIIEAFNSFAEALETACHTFLPADHAGRFLAISLAYREWAIFYPQRYLLIFGTPIPGYAFPPEVAPAGQRAFRALLDVVGAAYQAGALHLAPEYVQLPPALLGRYETLRLLIDAPYPPVVIQLSLAMWAKIHGLVSLELYNQLPGFLDDQVAAFIEHEVTNFIRQVGL